MEKWVLAAKRADFQEIGRKYGIDPVIARIIRNRDITEDAENYNLALFHNKNVQSSTILCIS